MVYVAHRFGGWWSLKMLLAMCLGVWRDRPEVDACLAREVVVYSRRPTLRVMGDGEAALLTPPLRFRIRPGALRVIVPDGPDVAEGPPADAAATA